MADHSGKALKFTQMPFRRSARWLVACLAFWLALPVSADFLGNGGPVRTLDISPDGSRLLSGGFDYTVRLWDFGTQKPMPVDLMEKQCETALELLRQGRIGGMIFLSTNICDLDLETVNWTRRWIAKVGDEPLRAPDRRTPSAVTQPRPH